MNFTVSLKFNHVFRRLYSKGKRASSSRLVLYCRKNGSDENRLGITASAKLGNAVCRNRIRRRLKEIYRTNEGGFERGWDIVAVARSAAIHSEYRDIEADFLRLADTLGIRR